MGAIKFGTDGWRAIIGDQFTFDNLERVTRATAIWLKKTRTERPKVVIGHDLRFQGRAFSEHVARVLIDEGATVLFADTFTTTPAVSWATLEYGCDAGIVITASHNPPAYSGFKIKAAFGGPATPPMTKAVEAEIMDEPAGRPLPKFHELVEDGRVELRDLNTAYLDALRGRLDIEAIRAAGLTVAHDAMYGASQGLVRALLGDDRVLELHAEHNPGFHGQPPEPIERNLGELAEAVVREGCAVGLANDGDADRIGMYDERGTFVTSHLILSLLVKYLVEKRGLTGDIAKTFSTTHMLDRMAAHYGLTLHTEPIGFKHIAGHIVEGDILVGGEESGGISAKGHIPERDGIYIGLLIVEMMVKRGLTLSALVEELYEQFGPHHTYRIDATTTPAAKERVMERLAQGGLDEVAGHSVTEVRTTDGYKHVVEDGWVLIRPSGTEPLLRVYSEGTTPELAVALVENAVEQLGIRDER